MMLVSIPLINWHLLLTAGSLEIQDLRISMGIWPGFKGQAAQQSFLLQIQPLTPLKWYHPVPLQGPLGTRAWVRRAEYMYLCAGWIWGPKSHLNPATVFFFYCCAVSSSPPSLQGRAALFHRGVCSGWFWGSRRVGVGGMGAVNWVKMLSVEREIGMNPSAGVEVQLCLLCQPMIDEGRAGVSRASAFYAVHVQLQWLGTRTHKVKIKRRMQDSTASQRPPARSSSLQFHNRLKHPSWLGPRSHFSFQCNFLRTDLRAQLCVHTPPQYDLPDRTVVG